MSDEPTTLDLLRRLDVQVKAAIVACEMEMMRTNKGPRWESEYDMVIGDFGIKILPQGVPVEMLDNPERWDIKGRAQSFIELWCPPDTMKELMRSLPKRERVKWRRVV